MKMPRFWVVLSWMGLMLALGSGACGTDSPVGAADAPDALSKPDTEPSIDVRPSPDVDSTPDAASSPDVAKTPDITQAPDTTGERDTSEAPDAGHTPDSHAEQDVAAPPTLADLISAFSGRTDGYQTSPNRVFDDLVVTVLKPDMGTELGGFFALDANQTGIYFAPAGGASDLPAALVAGSIIRVKIVDLTLIQGMIAVTEYSDLRISGAVDDLDAYMRDASDWTLEDWQHTQSAFIELFGMIAGPSTSAGGGGAWRRFPFISDGLAAESETVQLRLPAAAISYLGVEENCFFGLSAGAVWNYQGPLNTVATQYQAMFVDQDEFVLLCDPPRLLGAQAADPTRVTLTFSRPMDERSMTASSFAFTPTLQVLDVALSSDLKTVTLTTAEHASEQYTLTVGADVKDTTGEPVDATHQTMTFSATIPTHLAILYCFENSAGEFIQTPTVVAQGFSNVSSATRPGAVIKDYAGNGSRKPAECPPGNGKSLSTDATKADSKWPTEAAFDPTSSAYFTFSFQAPPGRVHILFDVQRSGAGPNQLAVWQSLTSHTIAENVTVKEGFTSYPMLPPDGAAFTFDVPPGHAGPIEVRIYPYGATATNGTFRIDNLTVRHSRTP